MTASGPAARAAWRAFLFAQALGMPLAAAPLETVTVRATQGTSTLVADGTVQAERQSVVAAQFPGRVTARLVEAGDRVTSGQPLLRIDARVADGRTDASRARAAALEAELAAATREYDRQQQLFAKSLIGRSALEQAEARFKSAEAQTRAQLAQARAASVQAGLHVLTAPYAGVVSRVEVEVGDMAEPGRPLLTLHDPSAMRVSVNVPQARIHALCDRPARVTIPGAPVALASLELGAFTTLPAADTVTQMVEVRIPLPAGADGLVPGMFARAELCVSLPPTETGRMLVPSRAVFRRSEVTAVYVMNAGRPQLRLVRVGRSNGEQTEIVAGLDAGDEVVLNPLAALPGH